MPSDKEILFQVLGREIDNLLLSLGPVANMLNQPIKNYLFNFIEPYVDAFISSSETHELDSRKVGGFVKEKANNSVNDFLKKFEEAKNGPDDYIV